MRALLFAAFIALAALNPGCACECDCKDDMKTARNKYGAPEEINTYSSAGYQSVSYWWWSKGINKDFKWGRYVDGCCDVSTYTFEPIHKSMGVDPDTLTLTPIEDDDLALWGIPGCE